MRETKDFVVFSVDEEKGVGEVVFQGKKTGKTVSSEYLAAALQTENQYLLFLVDNDLFSESLAIYLFDKDLNQLDKAEIWGGLVPTQTAFEDLKILDSKRVSFSFLIRGHWVLEVFDHAQFRLPLFSEPIVVWREFSFRRRGLSQVRHP